MKGGLGAVIVLVAVVAATSARGGDAGTSGLWTVRDDGSARQELAGLPAGTVLTAPVTVSR